MVLNLLPGVAIVVPMSSIIPVIFLIGIGLVTDLIEDIRRYVADRSVNNVPVTVLRNQTFESIPTEQVVVGDFVLLRSNEEIPADILLLSSSEPQNIAYVNTMNLDGEGNLKTKRSHPLITNYLGTLPVVTSEDGMTHTVDTSVFLPKLETFQGVMHCSAPNRTINEFAARLEFSDSAETVSLSHPQLLLRGCVLKNTPLSFGVVLYTGKETKMQLNSQSSKGKFSRLNRRLNWSVLFMFCLMLVYVFVANSVSVFVNNKNLSTHPYLALESMHAGDYAYSLFSAFVYFHNNLPTSLFVSIEIGRFIQIFFLQWDKQMCDESRGSDGKMIARTSNLNEELGMIRHVFSDKTGTLTMNKMDFQKCSTGISTYDTSLPSQEKEQFSVKTTPEEEPHHSAVCHFGDLFEIYPRSTPRPQQSNSQSRIHPEYPQDTLLYTPLQTFSLPKTLPLPESLDYNPFHCINTLLLCHEAVIESAPDIQKVQKYTAMRTRGHDTPTQPVELTFAAEDNKPLVFESIYQSTSPDEIALLSTIAKFNYCFLQRTVEHIEVALNGSPVKFPLVAILPFSSERRRMTVVVEMPDGSTRLYMKGADSSILPLCALANHDTFNAAAPSLKERYEKIVGDIEDFSSDGLRTLALATRQLDTNEAASFKANLKFAQSLIDGREEATTKCFDDLEHDLDLVGCTGVEDELQQNCKETISFLQKCGMNVWVLTGDKVATAVNVGFNCGLVSKHDKLCYITSDSLKEFDAKRVQKGEKAFFSDSVASSTDADHLKLPSRLPCRRKTEAEELSLPIQHLVDQMLDTALEEHKQEETAPTIVYDGSATTHRGTGNVALIADGFALNVIVSSALLVDKFLSLAEHGSGVICCRIAPMQKALIVRMVRSRRRDIITLAIGDGANDVSMIREAHVGVGIKGVEGTSASQVADYSISKFHFLKRLLVVHGHINYYRLSTMIKYSYFKNLAFCTAFVFFLAFSFSSFQVVYNSYFISFFNLLFTSIPILVTMLLDKDAPDWVLEDQPAIYKQYRDGRSFRIRTFVKWVVLGMACSAVNFFAGIAFFKFGETSRSGPVEGLSLLSSMLGNSAFACVSFVYLWKTQYHTILTTLGFVLSLLIYVVVLIFLTLVIALGKDYYFEFFHAFASPVHGLFVLFILGIVAVVFCLVYYTEREFGDDLKVHAVNIYIPGAKWPRFRPKID
ncbi:ion-transporting P-type ATPase [Blattamonas nauphoetae]|uniref:Phospholipid-transporting ATPase n=1 Tax=Blattamonas nauphoetae TaxID=2049346 RepID=A0ABQ9XQP9_9EUKA|nr:ion-transporting P-type ATPase [Blattamonas nauphoetae]